MSNNEEIWIADTNILLDNLQDVISSKKVALISTTRQELDKHKIAHDENLKYKAKKANRFIFENYDTFIHDVGEYSPESLLGYEYSNEIKDNRIIACAVAKGYGIITNDLNLYATAKAFNIKVETFDEGKKELNTDYTGIHKFYVTAENESIYAGLYQDPSNNVFNLLVNQYLIIYDKDKPTEFNKDGQPIKFKVIDKLRFDGKKLVPLKLPNKKVYAPRNEEQECAADLLFNPDIPIKIIAGTYGSGKTLSAIKMALYHVLEKGNQSKIMMVRNPIGSGESVGFLKGSKEDKTEGFFKAIIQHLAGGEQEAEILKTRGQLLAEIPYYMKGLSIEDTFIIADEAEDFDIKLFKLVGTRLGDNSVIAFTGDFKQAEDKYRYNNGLVRAIERLQGDPLVGIVVLEEDVRSNASKVFSKM